MSTPLRNGAWSALVSADETAPQRTAFRKASNLPGSSNPVGSGKEPRSTTAAPASSSHTTRNSSPIPSSSTDDRVMRLQLGATWPRNGDGVSSEGITSSTA